ncbi:MAG: RNA methyltransferase [Actinomycetes bacterium]
MTRPSDGGTPAQRWEDGDPDRGNGEFYQPIGVGPHPLPWPQGDHYDEALLAEGDRRNVVDKYRYWSVAAIRADLDATRVPLHVAIENWQHDLNIGSIVRTANAFNVSAVHIVGRRRWNRRGAMVTDRYMNIHHHEDANEFAAWAAHCELAIIGVEQHERSQLLGEFPFPRDCALFLGNEGTGLTAEAVAACSSLVEIPQSGSTRSINASAAGAIAMWEWWRQGAV